MENLESRVLVIGAGLAGLAAARELAHLGYRVTVLEARDRVGGRLSSNSLDDGNSAVDLGAAFIHGINDNPVATLAQDLDLTLVPMDHCKLSASDGHTAEKAMDERVQSLWNAVLDECGAKQEQLLQELEHEQQQQQQLKLGVATGHDSRGETSEESNEELSSNSGSDAPEVVTGNEPHVHGAAATAERNARTTCRDRKSRGANGSVAARTTARTPGRRVPVGVKSAASKRPLMSLGQVLEEIAEPHLAKFSEAERELWGWHRGNLEISCGADLNDLDHLHWNQDDTYDLGGAHVIIKEGYGALSSKVAETLDIRLNTEVKSIKLLDDAASCVEVVMQSKGKTTMMRAGYVVVTLPLGVLKSRLV
ncbi:unnamed protein product, partial [Sphacelaria rigidula]